MNKKKRKERQLYMTNSKTIFYEFFMKVFEDLKNIQNCPKQFTRSLRAAIQRNHVFELCNCQIQTYFQLI